MNQYVMKEECLEAGSPVRLVNNPGQVGTLTGRSREIAGIVHYQVRFPEGVSYQPEYELDCVTDEQSDFEGLIAEGRFGGISDLRRNLLYIQLSGRLANLVYSMDTTNTDFYAYQFKPVLSFLDSPSNGLLIADEVGLGKTIEAGLIWTELRARYDARRLVVVCPAMLREKWRDELLERFGVDAAIVNAGELSGELQKPKHQIPDGKGLVCSMQGIRPPRDWEDKDRPQNPRSELARLVDELSAAEPCIDLLIIDEAHYLRNPESQTAKLGKMLRDISEHVILLSATPVNLKSDDLFHLLNLVDPDTFQVKEFFPSVLEANEPLLKAREKALDKRASLNDIESFLIEAKRHSALRKSLQLEKLLEGEIANYDLSDNAERVKLANRIERINLLRHVVSRTRKIEVHELKVVRDPFTELVKLNEIEQDLYDQVTDATRTYAETVGINTGFLLATPQRQVSSCMYAALKSWKDKMAIPEEMAYEDFGTETDIEGKIDDTNQVSPLIDHLSREVLPHFNLDQLRSSDSKFERFERIVLDYLTQNPDEKIIVFSYFRYTLSYLSERLAESGISSQILIGGMQRTKQEVIDDFKKDPSIRILLSSEVASEGVDLQFCRLLINYDLPWNPMKVEQRIGRLDRIGQKADKISIWNLCYADTIDERILERLFDRLNIFKKALGGMEAILGEEIGRLTSDLLSSKLTKQQEEERIEKSALAVERIRQDEEEIEQNAAHMIAHGGYILEQVRAAHDFRKRISEQDLVSYVRDYLEKYCRGHRFQQLSDDHLYFEIQLPPDAATALDAFIRRKGLFGQTRLATGNLVQAEFLNKVPKQRQRIETISQFHPLIRFISDDLGTKENSFYPLVTLQLDRNKLRSDFPFDTGSYAFIVAKWTFEGLQVEEELRAYCVQLDGLNGEPNLDQCWELVSETRSNGSSWLGAASEVDTEDLLNGRDTCISALRIEFEKTRTEKELDNRDRVSFQIQSAERHRDRQLETHNQVLAKLIARGQHRLVPARQGLINKVKERFEVQVNRLETKGKLKSSAFELCFGAIKLL